MHFFTFFLHVLDSTVYRVYIQMPSVPSRLPSNAFLFGSDQTFILWQPGARFTKPCVQPRSHRFLRRKKKPNPKNPQL